MSTLTTIDDDGEGRLLHLRDSQQGPIVDDPTGHTAEALAMRAHRGCRDSFAALAIMFRPRLVYFLQRRAGGRDGAEDLAQETLVRAWQHIKRYDGRWRFSTWLYAIATRVAVDELRRRRRSRARPSDAVHMAESGSPQLPLEQLDEIWEASARLLTDTQQSALWLRYVEQLSIREISQAMGKSAVAVRVTLFRARCVLAEHLAGALPEANARPMDSSPLHGERPDRLVRAHISAGVTP
jgi:RNA polymerase sigma-70 factor (ECF subfamily)